jgi:hypothetical protein
MTVVLPAPFSPVSTVRGASSKEQEAKRLNPAISSIVIMRAPASGSLWQR